ncbi:unnamed protein product [Leptidea sinapis]|uniref:Uncharacterized protein n=1 Tax=Leptidea sinapis TaxID=189913 RepID=A0A5E4QP08_9NEOP|nr:unnamed protein product [Leptidea sinapis]
MSVVAIPQANGFWDVGTTTFPPERTDTVSRLSFFRWQRAEPYTFITALFFPWIDWVDQQNRRRLNQ